MREKESGRKRKGWGQRARQGSERERERKEEEGMGREKAREGTDRKVAFSSFNNSYSKTPKRMRTVPRSEPTRSTARHDGEAD